MTTVMLNKLEYEIAKTMGRMEESMCYSVCRLATKEGATLSYGSFFEGGPECALVIVEITDPNDSDYKQASYIKKTDSGSKILRSSVQTELLEGWHSLLTTKRVIPPYHSPLTR